VGTPSSDRPDLRGLWGFALTPFDGSDRVDEDAYRAAASALAADADVLCAAGTLGQGDRMTAAERLRCAQLLVEVAGSRPVMGTLVAGPGDTDGAADLLAAGVAAVLLLPSTGDAADAAASLHRIGGATSGRLPVVLYQRGPLRLHPAELSAMCELPHLVGLKDAHGDLRAFHRLRRAVGDRLTWIGASEDLVLGYWAMGADAWSPASLAYAPWYARAWLGALRCGDLAEAQRLMARVAWPITDLRLSRPDIDVTVVRTLAARSGADVGRARPPAAELTRAEATRLDELAAIMDQERERHAAASETDRTP
jgi:5-dehydro-4-deoxyglucarate dehydratase